MNGCERQYMSGILFVLTVLSGNWVAVVMFNELINLD